MGEQRPGPAGKPVVTAERVRLSAEPVRVGAPRAPGSKGEPTIELVREDGVVRAIDFICSCGERIRVRCDYE